MNQPTARAPVLVLGWGNMSRGDDALGPMCLAALRSESSPDLLDRVEFLEDYQLQIEHALDLAGRQRVLFVDASLTCLAPFEISHLQPRQDSSLSTHALSPQALMQVCQDLQSEPPPPCTLLAIRGESYELGVAPSATALGNLNQALRWAHCWLAHSDRSLPSANVFCLPSSR